MSEDKEREELVRSNLEAMSNARSRIIDLVNLYNTKAKEISAHSRIGLAVSEVDSDDYEDDENSECEKYGTGFVIDASNPEPDSPYASIISPGVNWFPSGLNC